MFVDFRIYVKKRQCVAKRRAENDVQKYYPEQKGNIVHTKNDRRMMMTFSQTSVGISPDIIHKRNRQTFILIVKKTFPS